ncbi:DedA family protein [Aureimonas sp. ME7]|uniref:DedA family protein n=1 Tax=Aureimonas sp. ME7 TaxID=2744252 RepID=UPI0015F7855A|nr:DedA family protein [Aureimonas sp. ME7]
MDAFLVELGELIRANPGWAAVIVAGICLGESLVLVGLVIPATAVMLLIGGMMGSGVIDPVTTLIAAAVGAVVGDVISYFLGRWLGPGIVHRRPLRRYRHAVAKTRLFFRRYGFWAVFLGRFLGPIRSTVPLVAGMMAMDQKRFQLANVLSAVVWAPAMFAPGWLGMKGAQGLTEMSGGTVLILLLGILAVTAIATVVGSRHFGRDRRARRPVRSAS